VLHVRVVSPPDRTASLGLSLAFAYWHAAWGSLLQLLLNVVLLVLVGAAGLSGQRVIWRRLSGQPGVTGSRWD
jgi:hypothetical protein